MLRILLLVAMWCCTSGLAKASEDMIYVLTTLYQAGPDVRTAASPNLERSEAFDNLHKLCRTRGAENIRVRMYLKRAGKQVTRDYFATTGKGTRDPCEAKVMMPRRAEAAKDGTHLCFELPSGWTLASQLVSPKPGREACTLEGGLPAYALDPSNGTNPNGGYGVFGIVVAE